MWVGLLLLIVLLYRWCLCVCDYCLLFVSTVCLFWLCLLVCFVCFGLLVLLLVMIGIRLVVVVLLALSVCWRFGLLWCDCGIVGCFAWLICLVFYWVVVCVCLWLFLFVCCYLCSFAVECWCFTVGYVSYSVVYLRLCCVFVLWCWLISVWYLLLAFVFVACLIGGI